MQILIATGNIHKFNELLQILPRFNQAGEVICYKNLADFGDFIPPEETGDTLEENARIKAVSAARATGLITLSDDTGLEVDALNGAPGVHTARYAGENADAAANNSRLLAALQHVPADRRTARFRTVACLAFPNGKVELCEGKVEGSITTQYQGANGFGYDPIFYVTEKEKTFAELSANEKNEVSHRGRAFRLLSKRLVQLRG